MAHGYHEARMPDEDEEGESHEFNDHETAVVIHTGGLQDFFTDYALKAASLGMAITEAFAEALAVKKRELFSHGVRIGLVATHTGAFIKLFSEGITRASLKTFGTMGVVGVLVTTSLEIGYAAYELYYHRDWTKFWKQTGRAIFTNGAGLIGGGAGATAGAAIGTALCPGVGTVIGGAIGGMIGTFFAAYAAGKAYDTVIPPTMNSEEKVKQALKEALAYFDLVLADLDNPVVFCADEINRKYRELAKNHHPDYPERGGSHDRFILLSTYYGLLKAALQDRLVKEKAKELAAPERLMGQ